jgi:hypothetical protein
MVIRARSKMIVVNFIIGIYIYKNGDNNIDMGKMVLRYKWL